MRSLGAIAPAPNETLPIPYPDCEMETIRAVAEGLKPGEAAFFEGGRALDEIPNGCLWQILPNGLGKLIKEDTRSVSTD